MVSQLDDYWSDSASEWAMDNSSPAWQEQIPVSCLVRCILNLDVPYAVLREKNPLQRHKLCSSTLLLFFSLTQHLHRQPKLSTRQPQLWPEAADPCSPATRFCGPPAAVCATRLPEFQHPKPKIERSPTAASRTAGRKL